MYNDVYNGIQAPLKLMRPSASSVVDPSHWTSYTWSSSCAWLL